MAGFVGEHTLALIFEFLVFRLRRERPNVKGLIPVKLFIVLESAAQPGNHEEGNETTKRDRSTDNDSENGRGVCRIQLDGLPVLEEDVKSTDDQCDGNVDGRHNHSALEGVGISEDLRN